MTKQTIFVEPADVWLFRDAKPFSAGENARATSLFPPSPQTMQGMVRSTHLGQHAGASFTDRSTWCKEMGTPDNYGNVKLRGPLVTKVQVKVSQSAEGQTGEIREYTKYFPPPQDLMKVKMGIAEQWTILQPDSKFDFETNWQKGLQPLLPPEDSEPTKFKEAWLPEADFLQYLQGQTAFTGLQSADELFTRESRFGVQIESGRKRPEEGLLYQVEYIRPTENTGLLLEVEGLKIESGGMMAVGGESRSGYYGKAETSFDLAQGCRLQAPLVQGKLRFKVYLAVPAFFEQGWLPKAICEDCFTGNWRGIEVVLRAVAMGKPQSIGGRDITQSGHAGSRTMRRAVPAGSVYYFETEATRDEVLKAFDGQCLSDSGSDAQIGFGLSYVGGW